jgi:hypothetical protein
MRRGIAKRLTAVGIVAAACGLTGGLSDGLVGVAEAQTTTRGVPRERATGSPQRDTLLKMTRLVEIDFTDTRLEDVMRFVQEITQADIEVFWMDDRNSVGLDKDALVTLKLRRATALDLVEKVLEKVAGESFGGGGNTWQMTESGTMQIGPKARLNKYKRVELYNVQDLLLELPNYTEAPDLDLQSVLQNTGQGGGSGQSPFQDNNDQGGPPRRPYDERLNELVNLITTLVEPEQWVDNGGDGASLRGFQGNLIVNAPDYVHRQINGYPYWPATATRVAQSKGRRWVTLGVDSSIAKLAGFSNVPVTAVTGSGGLISSDPNRGPGGSATPPKPGQPGTPAKTEPAGESTPAAPKKDEKK